MNFSDILKPGLSSEKTDTVCERNSASAWGSGGLSVYATPGMIALMEMAAHSAVDPLLPQGWATVGTELNVRHLSATPQGMKVCTKAELLNIDGRALTFKVEAFDEAGKIGEGTHKRFIVEIKKFIEKTERKNK